MNNNTVDYQNIIISILWHIVLFLIIILSFERLTDEKTKLVTPDRIQIVEINLKNVRVSGDETKLYNINQEQVEGNSIKIANSNIEKIELKQPTIIEDLSKKQNTKKQDKNIKKESESKAKHKTVVKVNREVLSLDRTLTISVVDALRVSLTRCWNIDTTKTDIEDIRMTVHLKMLPTGVINSMWIESESRAQTDPAFAYVLETVKEAIKTCQPFSMLPRKEYDKWSDITLTFYPSQGKIL